MQLAHVQRRGAVRRRQRPCCGGILRCAAVRLIGGPAGAQYLIFGLPVQEVPLYPDNYVDLTLPTNRIWGFQRDVTVHRFFVPRKDSTEYTVYVRMGVALEEKSAVAYATQAS